MATTKKYTKKPYKKYSTKRRLYKPRFSRRPASKLYANRGVTASRKPMQQIQYCTHETSFQALIPPGLSPGNDLGTIQAQVLATWTPAQHSGVNNRINYMMLCHQFVRCSKVIVKVESGSTVVASATGSQSQGKILLVPIHSPGDIVASGAGGGLTLQSDSNFWQTMPHVKVNDMLGGATKPLYLSVSPSVNRIIVRNPTWSSSGFTEHVTTEWVKGKWYSTRDYDGATATLNSDVHYGYTVFFSGFNTPVTFQIVKITAKYFYEFKGWDPTVNVQNQPSITLKQYLNTKEMEEDKEHKGPRVLYNYRMREFDEKGKMTREYPIGEGAPNQGHQDEEKYLHVEQEEEEEDMDPRPRGKRKESPTPSVHDLTRRMSRTLTNSKPI